MDIFFTDTSEIPLPPEQVRIRELRADPSPDGKRVRVYLEVDPFQKRPSVDLAILDQEGEEIATASIIESMTRKMELTMHLRRGVPGNSFTLHATLYFAALPEFDAEQGSAPIERTQVDSTEIQFVAGGLASAA
jgi:hypothetical protein